jgi:hypothetical protein
VHRTCPLLGVKRTSSTCRPLPRNGAAPFVCLRRLGMTRNYSSPCFPQKVFLIIIRHMIGLRGHQLKIVMGAARVLPVEKRDIFLQRIAAMLAVRGRGRFTDTDVADVAKLALCGLIQSADSAA